jgi:hypothetical protein
MNLLRTVYKGNITIDKKLGKVFLLTSSTDDTREMIQDVYLDTEKKRLVSTDGRVMFIYNLNDYESGAIEGLKTSYFRVVKSKEDTMLVPIQRTIEYPSVDRILSQERVEYEYEHDCPEFEIRSRETENCKAYYHMSKSVLLPLNYVHLGKILKNLGAFQIHSHPEHFIFLAGVQWELMYQGISLY